VAAQLQSPVVDAPGYRRFNFPRRDLTVRVGDVTLAPGLALGGWVGFAGEPGAAMLMGDLVVTAAELPAVMEALVGGGIEVTAVHNHLAGETPQVIYVHVHGRGVAAGLAAGVDAALRRTATPRPVTPAPPAPLTIDTALVFTALGQRGRAGGAVANVSFLLVPDTVRLGGEALVPALALGSPVNLQAIGGGAAVTTGDFAVLGDRAAAVIRALVGAGITPTAVHSHLIGERPTVAYIHFWGRGPLTDLVRGLRAAIDAVPARTPSLPTDPGFGVPGGLVAGSRFVLPGAVALAA
jgi:hypothetical protein